MQNAVFKVPEPTNEPVRSYAPGTPEKASIKARLKEVLAEQIEIPLIIGGREVRSGNTGTQVCPHDHGHVLATYHKAGQAEVEQAARAAAEAWHDWSEMDWEARASVILKAAELLAGPWRDTLNAATMLNQSKTVYQAEIDEITMVGDDRPLRWRHTPDWVEIQRPEKPPCDHAFVFKIRRKPLG